MYIFNSFINICKHESMKMLCVISAYCFLHQQILLSKGTCSEYRRHMGHWAEGRSKGILLFSLSPWVCLKETMSDSPLWTVGTLSPQVSQHALCSQNCHLGVLDEECLLGCILKLCVEWCTGTTNGRAHLLAAIWQNERTKDDLWKDVNTQRGRHFKPVCECGYPNVWGRWGSICFVLLISLSVNVCL